MVPESWTDMFRPVAVKVLTRGILWVATTALWAKAAGLLEPAGISTTQPSPDVAARWAAAVVGVILPIIIVLVDKWHNKTDLNTTPPVPPAK